MAAHNELGKLGEQKAADFLRAKGYRILAQNWRFHHKEVDVIAMDGSVLVVAEVRTRSGDSAEILHPRDSIGPMKIRYLVLAVDHYVRYTRFDGRVRFDVLSCLPKQDGTWEIEHLEAAFTAQAE